MTTHPIPGARRALAAGLVALCAAGCGAGPAPEPVGTAATRRIPVTLVPVRDSAITPPVRGTGVLATKEEVPLGFKIGGVVARILVDEGSAVRAGQLLAELAQPEIGAEVAKAEAAAAQAERDLARAEALYRDSVIARERYEGAVTGAEMARANLRIARFNEQYAVIRAPQAGTILRRLAEVGQQIGNGAPVLVLAGGGRGQVLRVGLADRDAARVSLGDHATVQFEGVSGGPLRGRVTQRAAAASPGSGAWDIEVTLLDPMPVATGLIGRVEIAPGRAATARIVPLAALLEGEGDSAVVYTVARDSLGAARARRVVVTVGLLAGDHAAITAGLAAVDSVVTAGAGYLTDGAAVATVPSGDTP